MDRDFILVWLDVFIEDRDILIYKTGRQEVG